MNKFDLITHYDLDGVGCAIMVMGNAKLCERNEQIIPIGYGRLDEAIDKCKTPCLMATDISFEQKHIDKIADKFEVLSIFDHHQGTTELLIPEHKFHKHEIHFSHDDCATKMLYDRYKDTYVDKLPMKQLMVLINDFDKFNLKHEQSLWLNELFWSMHFWAFYDAFKDGLNTKALKKGKELFDKKSIEYKTSDKMMVDDTLILFDVSHLTYAMYYNNPENTICIAGPNKMSIRSRNDLTDFYVRVKNTIDGVVSCGGHMYAGGIEFNFNITEETIEGIYEELLV